MTLTFRYDDLFTIATDERGRTYRVLLATGQPLAYRLKPWRDNGLAADYRGRFVVEGSALYESIDVAEKARPRPKPAAGTSRFEADFA